jgi:D-arabinose 1-dehydrogenase-like Zn-dependent alcohol dehydrogenase
VKLASILEPLETTVNFSNRSIRMVLADKFPDVGVETFLHKIPDALSSEDAAPLQCAGGTVYSALLDSAKPGDRVGILGIGGLGHLAIQFSAKLGFETIVFSSNAEKEAEAKSFGADEFYLLSEPEKLKKPIDVLLVAGSRYPDWSKYVLLDEDLGLG